MGITAIILVLLFALTPLLIRVLRPWIMRKLQERAIRYVYRQAGMEPPGTERKKRRGTRRQAEPERETEEVRSDRRRRRPQGWPGVHTPIIPPEYPVDVEFTETKDYSEETEITGTDNRSRFARRFSRSSTSIKVEEQVSDAEWEDIK